MTSQYNSNSNYYHETVKRRSRLGRTKYILNEWYGSERGSAELIAHQPEAVHVSKPLDRLIRDAFNPKESLLLELKKQWSSLFGHPVGTVAKPVKIEGGTLVVEVPRSAWLMEIKRYHHKTIKAKVDQLCGPDFCSGITYIASGRDQ